LEPLTITAASRGFPATTRLCIEFAVISQYCSKLNAKRLYLLAYKLALISGVSSETWPRTCQRLRNHASRFFAAAEFRAERFSAAKVDQCISLSL